MKKMLSLFLSLLMLLSCILALASCGEESPAGTTAATSSATVITATTATVGTTAATTEKATQTTAKTETVTETTAATTKTTEANEPEPPAAELIKDPELSDAEVSNHTFVRLWPASELDPLYNDAYDGYYKNQHATIAAYIVPDSEKCIVIFPGGGYASTTEPTEGTSVAEAYNKLGISCFVVHYRCRPANSREAIVADAQRSIQFARYYAPKFGYSADKIAVCGFSAGGHLAMLLCEHPAEENIAGDEIGAVSDRPNACILSYPVLVLDDGNTSTTTMFLAKDRKNQELVDFYSCTYDIEKMPATFLWYGLKDTSVKKEKNADVFVKAMKEAGMTLELHEFSDAKHGIGIASGYSEASEWMKLSVDFLTKTAGF